MISPDQPLKTNIQLLRVLRTKNLKINCLRSHPQFCKVTQTLETLI